MLLFKGVCDVVVFGIVWLVVMLDVVGFFVVGGVVDFGLWCVVVCLFWL